MTGGTVNEVILAALITALGGIFVAIIGGIVSLRSGHKETDTQGDILASVFARLARCEDERDSLLRATDP